MDRLNNNNQRQRKLRRSVYFAAFVVFVMLIGSVIISLFFAAREADRVASVTEQRIVAIEIDRQVEIVKRDQSQVSYWDQAYLALRGKPDANFISSDMADWLWDDFGIRSSLVVTSKNKVIVDILQDNILDPGGRQYLADNNSDLISQAVSQYKQYRKKQPGGYFVFAITGRIPKLLSVSAFRKIDGEMSIVTAQAIISDEADTPVAEEDVRVLLTIKPFVEESLEQFSERTNLKELRIFPISQNPENPNLLMLPNGAGAPEYYITWQPNLPFPLIVKASAPLLLILFSIAGLAIWFVGKRFGGVIHQLEESEASNRFLAQHDVLTGLPNRGKFDAEVTLAIEAQSGDGAEKFAVMSIDLDQFKAVNDTFGHQAGDEVIKTIAGRLVNLVADNGIVARMGGDEFTCLINAGLDRDTLSWLAESMVEAACKPIEFLGGQANVGASVGVALWPHDGKTLNALLRASDTALYQAKELGRSRVCYADNKYVSVPNEHAA